MSTLDELINLFEGAECAGPADEETISAAEAQLGAKFPESYKMFLARFGASQGIGFRIAGLTRHVGGDESVHWSDVVAFTNLVRRVSRGIPETYIPISDDQGDYTFYLATGRMGEDGECPVVVLGPGAEYVVVAKDFLDFAKGMIERTITW